MASDKKLIVAAIDFGTTHSSWAISSKHEYNDDPTNICVRQWHGGSLMSFKAPTVVLIKPDGETFDSFGYDAENKYAELVCEDQHKAWYMYYFRRCFKKMLHGKMTLNSHVKQEDETKKSLPAMKVFSLAIRYLVNDVLEISRGRYALITDDDIMWVLTVPAICNDNAKQFMREAAIMAGINESHIKLALEPETASFFCCIFPVEKMREKGGMCNFKPGSKYVVLDAREATVVITVHEVMPGSKLKEIHKPIDGAWGGTQVDEAFKQFIISLVGTKVFFRFEKERKDDYLDLLRDFELIKRNVSPESDTKVTIRCPDSLIDIFHEENGEDLGNAIKQTSYVNQVFMSRDKLRVDASVVKKLFSNVIQNIVSHLIELIKDPNIKGISSVLMVGEFSECKMLQNAVKSNFPNLRVIIPQDAGTVVLKGAVVFGHSPKTIF